MLQIATNVELHAAPVSIAFVGSFRSEDVMCALGSEYGEPSRLPRWYKNYSPNPQLYPGDLCFCRVSAVVLNKFMMDLIGEEFETCLGFNYMIYPK